MDTAKMAINEFRAKYGDEPPPHMGAARVAAHWAEYRAPRQTGKTTALCEAAKKVGATVVCVSNMVAKEIRKKHGVPTISLDSPDEARGKTLLFDTDAVSVLLRRLATPLLESETRAARCDDAIILLRKLSETSLTVAGYEEVLQEVRVFLADGFSEENRPEDSAEKMDGLGALLRATPISRVFSDHARDMAGRPSSTYASTPRRIIRSGSRSTWHESLRLDTEAQLRRERDVVQNYMYSNPAAPSTTLRIGGHNVAVATSEFVRSGAMVFLPEMNFDPSTTANPITTQPMSGEEPRESGE